MVGLAILQPVETLMISRSRFGWNVLLLAAGVSLASGAQAFAQWPPLNGAPAADTAPSSATSSNTTSSNTTSSDAAASDDADVKGLELDWSQLNVDAYTLAASPASKARVAPQGQSTTMSWSSQDKSNGASAVSMKQSVSSFWDARVGADMTVTREPTTLSELLSEKVANGGSAPQSDAAAYAAITAPGVASIWDKTSVEARIDPSQDQRKVGTALSKALPLNQQYSVTLEGGYNVVEQGALPVPGLNGKPVRTYEADQSAKLNIADTGTSLIAGQTLSSTDDRWLRKIGAEQKLFGGVSVTGSIGETSQGVPNRSLVAGFKQSW